MEWLSPIKPPFGTPLIPGHWANKGLVASYLMNEMGGNKVYDSSGYGNHGTMIGMAPMSPASGWVPGLHGGALAFNGSSEGYVDISKTGVAGDRDSCTYIIQTVHGAKADGVLFSDAPSAGLTDYNIHVDVVENVVRTAIFIPNAERTIGTANIGTGSLHQIALTIDHPNNVRTLYVDGIFNASDNYVGTATIKYTRYLIGAAGYYLVGLYKGTVSSFSIHNRALSAEQVAYKNAFPWCGYEDEGMGWGPGMGWDDDGYVAIRRYYSIPSIGNIPNIPSIGKG